MFPAWQNFLPDLCCSPSSRRESGRRGDQGPLYQSRYIYHIIRNSLITVVFRKSMGCKRVRVTFKKLFLSNFNRLREY